MSSRKERGFYQLRGHSIDDKNHYEQRIKYLYKELFNLKINLRDMPSCGVYGFQIWSDGLVNYKNKILGLPLGKKLDFSIPLEIIKNKDLARSFLRGFFDTDGCLYLENKKGKLYPRVEMASISERFMNQVQEILLNLGFRFSFYKEHREKKGWRDLYRIIIRGNEMAAKWFSEIKPANLKHIEKFNDFLFCNNRK